MNKRCKLALAAAGLLHPETEEDKTTVEILASDYGIKTFHPNGMQLRYVEGPRLVPRKEKRLKAQAEKRRRKKEWKSARKITEKKPRLTVYPCNCPHLTEIENAIKEEMTFKGIGDEASNEIKMKPFPYINVVHDPVLDNARVMKICCGQNALIMNHKDIECNDIVNEPITMKKLTDIVKDIFGKERQ